MEMNRAQEIVRALANRVDPTTGEILPGESPYNHPEVIRALYTLVSDKSTEKKAKKTVAERQQGNLRDGKPKNAGMPWTEDLQLELASKFEKGEEIKDLAVYFERTRGGIRSQLVKQGLLEE